MIPITMKRLLGILLIIFSVGARTDAPVLAQSASATQAPILVQAVTPTLTTDPTATPSATLTPIPVPPEDITLPEELEEQEAIALFEQRPVNTPTLFNFMAYTVQYAALTGVPTNTIILVLLLPLLASIVAFVRHIIGLPSLEMIVPITLSITLLATGITAGAVLLITILLASTFAQIILKRVRIMQLPKMALSLWVVSIFVFIALLFSASIGILRVRQISIFPVLLFILLGERIVALQLERSVREMLTITFVTLSLGMIGFLLLSSNTLRTIVLVYPEITLLVIPINIAIGRYFGLRLMEYFRFSPILQNGSK